MKVSCSGCGEEKLAFIENILNFVTFSGVH